MTTQLDAENLMEGIACPHCGQNVCIDVECHTNIRIDREDIEILDGNFSLFEGCRARCPDCMYVAPFQEFEIDLQSDDTPTVHPSMQSNRVH